MSCDISVHREAVRCLDQPNNASELLFIEGWLVLGDAQKHCSLSRIALDRMPNPMRSGARNSCICSAAQHEPENNKKVGMQGVPRPHGQPGLPRIFSDRGCKLFRQPEMARGVESEPPNVALTPEHLGDR